jgi:hypothetical protein
LQESISMANWQKRSKSLDKNKSADDLEDRLVHYSEQLGWLVGTVQAKTEGWLDRAALTENLTRIRDGATDLLSHLTSVSSPNGATRKGGAKPRALNRTRKANARAVVRSASLVAAPGKRHRPPAAPTPSVKHSDERLSKLKAANMKGRRGGRG